MSLSDESMSSGDEEEYPTPSEAGDNLEKTFIDRLGDLTLCVGPHLKQYQVCSRTVARASPVFMRMFNGNFVESRPSIGDWVINLPDDASQPMKLFLNMTHGNFGSIPQTLSTRGLYELIVLLDKYDALEFIRPWAGAWIEDVSHNLEQPALLYIARELGDAQLFQKVLKDFARHGWVMTSQGELEWSPDAEPPPYELQEPTWVPGHGSSRRHYMKFPLDFTNMTLSEFEEMFMAAQKALANLEFDPYVDLLEALQREDFGKRDRSGPIVSTSNLSSVPLAKDHFKCGAHICFKMLLNFRDAGYGIPTRHECEFTEWREAQFMAASIDAEISALECSGCREWAQQYLKSRRESLTAAEYLSQDHLSYFVNRAVKTGLAVTKMKA